MNWLSIHISTSRLLCCDFRKDVCGAFCKTAEGFSSFESIMNEQCPSNIWNAALVTECSLSAETKCEIANHKCGIINCETQTAWLCQTVFIHGGVVLLGGSVHK